MATCLAENTARAISSTWQHACVAKGMMMRREFAGFAFWLWPKQREIIEKQMQASPVLLVLRGKSTTKHQTS